MKRFVEFTLPGLTTLFLLGAGCSNYVATEEADLDQDGYKTEDGDCDDLDASSYPGGTELPDGRDNDCDGTIDEGTIREDIDGDGYSEYDGDCDETDPSIHPYAQDDFDGIDNDCDGYVDEASHPERTDQELVELGASDADRRLFHQYGTDDFTFVTDTRWVGDLDADGYDDFVISVLDGNCTGQVFVFYGPFTELPSSSNMLDSADAVLHGIADPNAVGAQVRSGDLDGDGYSDLLIGDPYNRRISIFFGGERMSGVVDAELADATIRPVSGSYFPIGASLEIPGDLDGDGMDDLLVGQPYYSNARGRALLFYGQAFSGTIDLEAADASWEGLSEGDAFGSSFLNMGDFDGDGLADFAMVAPNAEVPEDELARGRIYVEYGSASREGTTASASDIKAVLHAPQELLVGGVKASAGDFDGDGYDDVLLGFPFDWNQTLGRGLMIYGSASRVSSSVAVDQFAQTQILPSPYGIMLGASVSLADLTGDGLADMVLSTPFTIGDVVLKIYKDGDTIYFQELGVYLLAGNVAVFQGSTERPRTLEVGVSGGTMIGSEDLVYVDIVPDGQLEWEDMDEMHFLRPLDANGDGNGDGRADLLMTTELFMGEDYYMANQAYIFSGERF